LPVSDAPAAPMAKNGVFFSRATPALADKSAVQRSLRVSHVEIVRLRARSTRLFPQCVLRRFLAGGDKVEIGLVGL
jgi:hypothetical protein